jgi:hypothetical protein
VEKCAMADHEGCESFAEWRRFKTVANYEGKNSTKFFEKLQSMEKFLDLAFFGSSS